MFFDCLNYYKKNCRMYNRVFQHMKLLYVIFKFMPILFTLQLIISLTYLNIITTIILGIITIFTFIYVFNEKTKKIINEKYHIEIDARFWNTDEVCNEFFKLDVMTMKEYTSSRALSEYKIKKLLKRIEDEIPKYKQKFPVVPSFIAALFVALWNIHLQWLYSNIEIKTINVSFVILLVCILGIILIYCIYFLGKLFTRVIFEFVYTEEYFQVKRLYEIMDFIVDEIIEENS